MHIPNDKKVTAHQQSRDPTTQPTQTFLTLICRFMVMQKSVMKYMTSMGQKTGMLNTWKAVKQKATVVAFMTLCQNLNSGSRRSKGRNSSVEWVGRVGPSMSSGRGAEQG